MYMISCFLTPCLMPKWMEARVWLMSAAFFLGVSLYFVGPCFVNESLAAMCIGLFFTGSFLGPLIIPNMAEMIAATQQAYPDSDLEHANSIIGGILNAAYGVGGAVGPLMGTLPYQFLGFSPMCAIVGSLCIVFAVMYFLTCKGCEAFATTFNKF